MDLQTFVAETLRQILKGVQDAQSSPGGGNVNAEMFGTATGHLINGGTSGLFTRVDFDVAVSAETTGGAKGNLVVFGVGVSGGADRKQGFANRISFSVPVRLPDGKRAPADVAQSYNSNGDWQTT
jgi:hypothetical protein